MVAIFTFSLVLLLIICKQQVECADLAEQQFEPQVTASCDSSTMTVLVKTQSPFWGVVHAKDRRNKLCSQPGSGSTETRMRIDLQAREGDDEYCGVVYKNKTDERMMPIAVRFHSRLEVAEDKLYVITCGKPGFKNSRDERSVVSLDLLDEAGHRTKEVVRWRPYTLQVKVSQPDEAFDVAVRECMGFSTEIIKVNLIDKKGCLPPQSVVSKFVYNRTTGIANSHIRSMFRFPDTNQVNIQCDVVICKGKCVESSCPGELLPAGVTGRSLKDPQDAELVGDESNNARLMASTSVMVVEADQMVAVRSLADCDEDGYRPAWLLYLCIAFGLLFLIMMIINCFLCTAMTCSCTKTEVVEKEPSLEDYDPYRSWHGSQYSLNGKSNHGYDYGASTMNSAHSVSTTNSDHYAMVQSRPVSRYSESQRSHHPHHHPNHNHHLNPQQQQQQQQQQQTSSRPGRHEYDAQYRDYTASGRF